MVRSAASAWAARATASISARTAPGDTITYTIECENVGEGTAYGVFITSELPPELDESTLNVADGGTYWPGSRALVWEIGELASKAGSIVTFSAQVPSSAISGTIIAADATVYFPSVPETTPTNSVVTIIEDVVAHSQQIETPEDVPADLTLTGSSPRPNPLSFSIIEDPLNGALSGEVAYDSTRNVARFTPSEPLAWDETYTVTVTTAVHDSSGNPMAADYVWSFHTEVGTRVYLPLVLKH